MTFFFILLIFSLGYLAIIFEYILKVNKAAIAIFMAVSCWMVYFLGSPEPFPENVVKLNAHLAPISQIVFFLLGAMTIVELIDSHKGFKIITDMIKTRSRRSMIVIVAFVTFFLSAVLDNLTTTILMVSLLRKLIPDAKERILLGCLVVIAANAGGAWTPIGDVTTTMLWIDGQLSTLNIMSALFLPSMAALLVPLGIYLFQTKGRYKFAKSAVEDQKMEPGAVLILCVGIFGLIFVPIFKTLTGLPPFMGILISLAVLWLVTDGLHRSDHRRHLKVSHILTKVDISGILFFLGILLTVASLEASDILPDLAAWLSTKVTSVSIIATLIGLLSAVVDNVPLVAATMGMYSLQQFPTDSPLWELIAFTAGTGGSILIVGSAAGIALMSLENINFSDYLKKATIPALLGYFAGIGIYLIT
jgi:Na+/H+ antiporter NhaD/arsenite permease-like protein